MLVNKDFSGYTLAEIKTAIKKCQIAIDKIVDIQDLGMGTVSLEEAQGEIQMFLNALYYEESRRYGENSY